MSMLLHLALLISSPGPIDCSAALEQPPQADHGPGSVEVHFEERAVDVEVRIIDRRTGAILSRHAVARDAGCVELSRISRILLEIWRDHADAGREPEVHPREKRAVRATDEQVNAVTLSPLRSDLTALALDPPPRLELSVLGGGTLGGRTLSSAGAAVYLRYRLLDALALEAGALALGRREDRAELWRSVFGSTPGFPVADSYTTTWAATGGVELMALRAPASFVGQRPARLGVFMNAGFGLGTASRSDGVNESAGPETLRAMGSFGGGLEFGLWSPGIALRGELRDFVFGDPASDGLTHDWMALVGLNFALEPSSWSAFAPLAVQDATEPAGPLRILVGLGVTPADTFTDSYSIALAASYWLSPHMALELRGMASQNSPSALATIEGSEKLRRPAAETAQLAGSGTLGPRLALLRAPLFGGSVEARLDAFAAAGISAVRFVCLRQEVQLDPETFGAGQSCPEFDNPEDPHPVAYTPLVMAFTANFGVGLEFEIERRFTLGLELRDQLFWASIRWPEAETQASSALRQVIASSLTFGVIL